MSKHKEFWNKEYRSSEHLALSTDPSEDLVKFTRWLEREYGREFLNPIAKVVDLGTGNGRNLIYLAESYGMRGSGYDISDVAIGEAQSAAQDLPLEFAVHSIDEPIPEGDSSATLVLDMMTSHFLKKSEREALLKEIVRILKPGGWLFFKSHLADEDLNVKRLLKEHPADEAGAYIHPKMGVYEYVWTEEDAIAFFEPHFQIHKVQKSHRHLTRRHGKVEAGKRRTFSMYLQKN